MVMYDPAADVPVPWTTTICSIHTDSVIVEMFGRQRRAHLHAALGDPIRLAVVERLLTGDVSPGELGSELEIPSNLMAHHLKVLEDVGFLDRRRSEGDGRRTYMRLAVGALEGLAVQSAGSVAASRVVFVCSQNSARSQLADAVWRRISRVASASAGTRPADTVHPKAVQVARRHGLSLPRARPHHIDEVLRSSDLVVAVCDNAHEDLTVAGVARLHWSIPDPVRVGSDAAFERAFTEIEGRVARLATAVAPTTSQDETGPDDEEQT